MCHGSWDERDARVACRQLGFPEGNCSMHSYGLYPLVMIMQDRQPYLVDIPVLVIVNFAELGVSSALGMRRSFSFAALPSMIIVVVVMMQE